MEFNKYNLYSMNGTFGSFSKVDEIDQYIEELKVIDEYSEVKDFIEKKFGEIHSPEFKEYPELGKMVTIVLDDEKVEFCALKNNKQYYGKGWRLISDK